MKSALKTKVLSCLIACAILFGTIGFINISPRKKNLAANATSVVDSGYYYDQLPELSKKFYVAIDKMNEDGLLQDGDGSYDLIANNVLQTSDVKSYAKGDSLILTSFEAGKNAYYLDHPEVFYVDFDKLSVSLGVKENGFYTATIDAGRADSYFAEGYTVSKVQEAIEFYEGSTGISSLIPVDGSLTTIEKIKFVNAKIIERTNYSYSTNESAMHIRSAYGALKYNVSIAEGYSKTFKACMDELGIECVQVNGYLASSTSVTFESHVWNYVKLDDGNWYAVDVALNDKTGISAEKYLCVGSEDFNLEHLEDCVLSDNGFKFKCPTISDKNLNEKTFNVETVYGTDTLTVKMSYNGKNATKLLSEDGLYLVVYRPIMNSGLLVDGTAEAVATLYPNLDNTLNYSSVEFYPPEPFVKVAVTNVKPLANGIYTNLSNSDLMASEIVVNELYGTEVEIVRPQANVSVYNEASNKTYTDVSTKTFNSEETWKITLTYDKDLKKVKDTSAVGIGVTSFNDVNVGLSASIENVEWNENSPRKITFTFTPSKMYQHNNLSYIFTPTNLIDVDTNTVAEPMSVSLKFAKDYVSCSKVFEDGRLYLNPYTAPTLIDNKNLDLVADGWKNSNGNAYLSNQRSELSLTATKPSGLAQEIMLDSIKETFEIENKSIYTSEAYELSLNVSGTIPNIPKGSYLKVAFAFPQGYNYNSLKKGVTFKVYEFEKNSHGNIDYETPVGLECVITEYGLVVTTDKFGQFVVVAMNEKKVETSKTIYARTSTIGGTVVRDNATNQRKMIETIAEDGEYTYSITAEDGYKLDYVILNGKDVTEKVENGKITLKESELDDNNTLDIAFVSEAVKTAEDDEKITNLNLKFALNQNIEQIGEAGGPKSNTLMIVLIIVGSAVLVSGAVVVTILVVKKKKKDKK